jgi:methylated-DNA-[protein]-cysteine S-methyltransferase
MSHSYKIIGSPVGKLTLIADQKSLLAVLWDNDPVGRVKLDQGLSEKNHPILVQVESQLAEYFEGERTSFDLPLKFAGTEFQNKVWRALQKIPYGETVSYSVLAKKIGTPEASRAVGAANGKNPLSIIVPCHRVIGANGKLTGFAGGLNKKKILINGEQSRQFA